MLLPESSRRVVDEKILKLPGLLARLYSNYALRLSGRPGMIGWNESEARQREADAFQFASLGFALLEGGEELEGSAALRRSAEVLEWLQGDREDVNLRSLSAMLYQIAGFSAIAQSLTSGPNRDILSLFMGGEFADLEPLLMKANEVLGSDPLNAAPIENEAEFFSQGLISAVSTLVAYMRWGDQPSVSTALDIMSDVAKYEMLCADQLSWLLARSSSIMAARFVSTSLRTVCAPLIGQLSPSGRSALDRYLREAYKRNRSIAWPSQIIGIEALLQGRDFALCTPTGSGKTTIAELAIIQALFSGNDNFLMEASIGRLVLYIVPSRALAYEVERRLRLAFSHSQSFPVQVVRACSH